MTQKKPKYTASSNQNSMQKYVNITKNKEVIAEESQTFTVGDSEFSQVSELIRQPKTIDPEELRLSLNSVNENDEVKKFLSNMIDAYSSLSNAITANQTNCSSLARSIDDNSASLLSMSEQLSDEVAAISKNHLDYVEKNENDKQEIKVKMDVRHFKYQMIIYLKSDDNLKSLQYNNTTAFTEKLIQDQGLSLGHAYIAKAVVLSGMKKINQVNKFTRYLYVHFSDAFTAERLISEMISKNKKSTSSKNPDIIFTQPTSYDIRRVKNICHELQNDGTISKVFLGDDAIKVTLNKKDPNDANEKLKKVYIRNFSDLDNLRKNNNAKNSHVPSRSFYNSDYWKNKYAAVNSNGSKRDKRKAAEELHSDIDPIHPKKQRVVVSRASGSINKTAVESPNSSFSSANDEY